MFCLSGVLLMVSFLQLASGQSMHAGRYYASAPVFASAPALPPGPAPCGEPGLLPVAAPPLIPPLPPAIPFGPAMPAAAPGLVPAMAPPMAACAPGFPIFGGGFGPFGSNKQNHPVGEEEKTDAPVSEPATTVDPSMPKPEIKLPAPVEFAVDNSTQPTTPETTGKPQ